MPFDEAIERGATAQLAAEGDARADLYAAFLSLGSTGVIAPLLFVVALSLHAQEPAGPLAPVSAMTVIDATGKVVGYPIDVQTHTVRIPFRLPDERIILLGYSIVVVGKEPPRVKWGGTSTQGLRFSGRDCTGTAFTPISNTSGAPVIEDLSLVVDGNGLWVASGALLSAPTAALSSTTEAANNVCETYGTPSPYPAGTPMMMYIGDLDDMFVPPFRIVAGSRQRAVGKQ